MIEFPPTQHGNYRMQYFQNNSDTICVVSASTGLAFGGKPINEFYKTIEMSQQCISVIWIHDLTNSWCNSEDLELLHELEKILSNYDNHIFLGESMGGSNSLYFCSKLGNSRSRILCFGPQYSIKQPFILFNTDCGPPSYRSIRHNNYAYPECSDKTLILFGADSWQDYIHSAFFAANGFPVYYIKRSMHNVARALKDQGLLIPLLQKSLDFSSGESWQNSSLDILSVALSQPSEACLSL